MYDLLKVFEFSSERKMMSVVVKSRSNGQVMVFAKGASDGMATRLVAGNHGASDLALADKFASEGLRTLAFGCKTVQEENLNLDSATA